LLNCKKLNLEDKIIINEKLKKFHEKIDNNNKENNIIDKLLNVDDEKIFKIFDLIASGKKFYFNFDDNMKEEKNNDYINVNIDNNTKVNNDVKIPLAIVSFNFFKILFFFLYNFSFYFT
jgi:hypothetical protein